MGRPFSRTGERRTARSNVSGGVVARSTHCLFLAAAAIARALNPAFPPDLSAADWIRAAAFDVMGLLALDMQRMLSPGILILWADASVK